ncbi:hypothetical protein H257_04912 [Aphanomyces astaci]|uniref:Uncharacterized protein n=1 Tax=Aphanomyces astaci TaxID=112090 RepID=W4GR81_APHAT|nr:hypothetical protein H257_04912 [Aphanomyces astaci]ETV82202.1 hypothetical protein H257_04912 [Aphanomyces astaci]RQM22165.1 hypothetical protein B5M09_003752 [Aphanomyces astaci]|eukprot:XP_009827871.1 hypothetical protein H257_04912 [Aphanomyces astaci]
MAPRFESSYSCVATSLLLSPDLMHVVVAYQHGIQDDVRPFLEFAIVSSPDAIDSAYVSIVNQCHAMLMPWLATFGPSRLGKLFECIPAMHHLVACVAICSVDHPLLVHCLRQQPQSSANLLGMAAYANNTRACEYLIAHNHTRGALDAMDWAAINGNLDMIVQLRHAPRNHSGAIQQCLDKGLQGAALNGHRPIVQYLLDNGLAPITSLHHPKLFNVCASRGHLAMIQYMFALGCSFTTDAMDAAATNGHLDVVQWMHASKRRDQGCTYVALAGACRNGHLEIVTFLHRHRAHDCCQRPYIAQSALEIAAANGHLDIVMYLHVHRFSDGALYAMDAAAEHGHLHVLQWLHLHRSEGFTSRAVDLAAKHNHLDVVRWLVSISACQKHSTFLGQLMARLGVFQRQYYCTTRAMDDAAANGHLEMVQWLHEHTGAGCTVAAVDQAARGNHLEVVQWLLFNRREGGSTDAMDFAAANGHLEMLQWLHQSKDAPGCTTEAMDNACRGGFLGVVQWLHANRSEGCSRNALMYAASLGHLDVVEWLLVHRRGAGCDGCTRRVAKSCGININDTLQSTPSFCSSEHTNEVDEPKQDDDGGVGAVIALVVAVIKLCLK